MSDRFWSKVDATGDCWQWVAARTRSGYGNFYLDGRHHVAHRVAWESLVGPIPAGLQLDHLCRNRACVNPAHLEPVTGRENLLRGIGPSARHAVKTHCPRGHEYAGHNLMVIDNQRKCRACTYARNSAAYARRKAAA